MASGNTLIGNTITGSNSAALRFYTVSSNNWVENNTLLGTVGAVGTALLMDSASNNSTIIRNNITGNISPTISIYGYNNTFILNRINATGAAIYINDTTGANFYNSTYAGKNQGNAYANVLNGSVNISGLTLSSLPSLYIGFNGSGYPYNNSTSGGKFVCSFSGCGDKAPLTPTQIPIINNGYGAGITGVSFRPLHAFASNVEPVNQTSNIPLFSISALVNGTYNLSMKQTPAIAGFTVKCAPNYNKTGLIILNTTLQQITNVTYSDPLCYQESANVSTACGGLATGTYFIERWQAPMSYLTDGLWDDNYLLPNLNYANLYVNYSKPPGATNASTWRVGAGNVYPDSVNLTIPASCWAQNPLQLWVYANKVSTPYSNFTCYNGTTWVQMRYDTGASASALNEEAMWWNLPASPTSLWCWADFNNPAVGQRYNLTVVQG